MYNYGGYFFDEFRKYFRCHWVEPMDPHIYARKLVKRRHKLSRLMTYRRSCILYLIENVLFKVFRLVPVRYNRFNREFKTQPEEEY